MRYFNHDTNASSDELLIQLRLEHGLAAVAVYWAVLEYIYSEEKPLVFGENRRETKSVLFRLGLGFSELENYLKTMVEIGLLISRKSPTNDCEFITSSRANKQIDTYQARAESARQNGKKGGRPKKPNENPEKTQSVSSSVSEKNRSEKLIRTRTKSRSEKKELPNGNSKEKPRFSAPTPEQVKAYATERGVPSFDAERFCDFYASKGWKVGSTPMKDWQAAVRNWLRDSTPKEVSDDRFAAYR